MKFSVNWLREFVDLPPTIHALADLLTISGIEIEAIEKRGVDIDKVVVAEITKSKQHPNADRLSVCEVTDGSGKTRQIVCGATNYKVGDKVPLALPGAELENGLKIRASKLRGVESEGMLCSAKELGLGDDANGLLILSPEVEVGAPLGEIFLSDTVFDVEITPNRGDLLSHFGLAREIGALTGQSLRTPKVLGTEDVKERRGDVTISATRECPFFSLRRIENLKLGPSPNWLRGKIESVGVRSINNVVDISNFVMLELGQPTHAFDATKLQGNVNVRLAREAEKFVALDGKTYSLGATNLVVADTERAIGIAGVMGGEESGVSESTTTVLLESAYFLPGSIRRTARDLNLPSDASYRFERGVDPQMVLRASQRVTELICEITGGKAADEINIAGELPPTPPDVKLRHRRLETLVGARLEPAIADAKLERFGLRKEQKTKSTTETSWRIPSYRRDLQREIDLIEEVVRAYGIEKIPNANRSRFTPSSEADHNYDFETELRCDLVALGLNETRTPALIARVEFAKTKGAVALRNPLSEDHVALRTSLIPGLLGALERNVRTGAGRIALFEIGNVFAATMGEQSRMLAIVLNGQISSVKNWRAQKDRQFDFFDLKGILEALVPAAVRERQSRRKDTGDGYFDFRRVERASLSLAAEVFLGEERLGFCGILSAAEASATGASGPILLAELDVAAVARTRRNGATFSEMDRFPSIRRDIAMFVPSKVGHEEIMSVITAAKEPLLERAELFDLFSEKSSGEASEARKSLAYSLTYRDKNRTLTNEEVSAVHARIRERLRKEIDAELRE